MSFCYCHHCCCLMAPCWLQVINFGPSEINKTLLYLRHLLSSCHTECKSNYLADLFYWVQGKRKEQMETLICQTLFLWGPEGIQKEKYTKNKCHNETLEYMCIYQCKTFSEWLCIPKIKKRQSNYQNFSC